MRKSTNPEPGQPCYADVAYEDHYVEDQEIVNLWEAGFSVTEIQAGVHKSTWLIYRILRERQANDMLKRWIRPYEPMQ